MEKEQGKSRLTRMMPGKGTAVQGQPRQTGEEPTQPVPPKPTPIFRQPAVVRARSLHVRSDHSMNADTVSTLRSGDKITVLETWSDGRDTWARIGYGQWAAITYNGQKYIELI